MAAIHPAGNDDQRVRLAVPVIEGSHILALPISVGMIVMFDLRLLGLAKASKVTNEFLRWSMFGFAVMFITGVFLFITQAGKAYGNQFFRTKLLLLLALGINALFRRTRTQLSSRAFIDFVQVALAVLLFPIASFGFEDRSLTVAGQTTQFHNPLAHARKPRLNV